MRKTPRPSCGIEAPLFRRIVGTVMTSSSAVAERCDAVAKCFALLRVECFQQHEVGRDVKILHAEFDVVIDLFHAPDFCAGPEAGGEGFPDADLARFLDLGAD